MFEAVLKHRQPANCHACKQSRTLSARPQVHFIDFGNEEVVEGGRVRAVPPALASVPPQAQPATLAYLKVLLAL